MMYLNSQEQVRARFAAIRGRSLTAIQSVLFVNTQPHPPADPLLIPLDKALAHYPGLSVRHFEAARLQPEQVADQLLNTVKQHQPDLVWLSLPSPQAFQPDWLAPVTWQTDTVTCLWVGDDSRFRPQYAQTWLPAVDYIISTAPQAQSDYAAWGGGHQAIQTHWACLPHLHHRLPLEPDLPVTFIGPATPARQALLQTLLAQNLPAAGYGPGWSGASLPPHAAAHLINRSQINLNLPAAAAAPADLLGQRALAIMACGGFLLTPPLPHLSADYTPGQEFVVFESAADLADKIAYYLAHPAKRQAIARAGYERTHREHTWNHRLNKLFVAIDVAPGNGDPPLAPIAAIPGYPGAAAATSGQTGFVQQRRLRVLAGVVLAMKFTPSGLPNITKANTLRYEVWFFDYRGQHQHDTSLTLTVSSLIYPHSNGG
jgi:spore maturation protein CgeB